MQEMERSKPMSGAQKLIKQLQVNCNTKSIQIQIIWLVWGWAQLQGVPNRSTKDSRGFTKFKRKDINNKEVYKMVFSEQH